MHQGGEASPLGQAGAQVAQGPATGEKQRRAPRPDHRPQGRALGEQGRAEPLVGGVALDAGGRREGEGIYILQNLVAARSLAKSMDQMIGDWSMVRGSGRQVCGLTLTNTEAGDDNYQLFLKPRCDPQVQSFAPVMWRLEHGGMMLIAKSGETWRFEPDDNAQWRRVPDTADPLIMLRQ